MNCLETIRKPVAGEWGVVSLFCFDGQVIARPLFCEESARIGSLAGSEPKPTREYVTRAKDEPVFAKEGEG